MTISGYDYPTFLQKQVAHKERAVQIQQQLYDNCDMFTLEELFDSISFAQAAAVTDVVSTVICCDVDNISHDYAE